METEKLLGTVTNIDDPAKAGRIKVACSTMDGDEWPLWVDAVFPRGWVVMPEVGDTVEVELPTGDDAVEFPEEARYKGHALDDKHATPDDFKKNYPKRRGFYTDGGHLLIFDDTSGEEEITISHKGKMLVSLTNQGIFFGTQSASEPFVLGNAWKSLESNILGAIATHTHPVTSAPGTSGPPSNATAFTGYQSDVNAKTQLSDFIFGQKVQP